MTQSHQSIRPRRAKKGSGPTLPCQHCGTLVKLPQNRADKFRFCSRKCGWAYKAAHEQVNKNCAICGTGFSVIKCREKTARYCSKPCRIQALKGRGGVILNCPVCGKEYRRSPSHLTYNKQACSLKCGGILKRLPAPNSGTDYPSVRAWMKRNGKLLRCEECGFSDEPRILVVHHKDRDRTNNDLANLAVLCPNCHALEHLEENVKGWRHVSTKRKRQRLAA